MSLLSSVMIGRPGFFTLVCVWLMPDQLFMQGDKHISKYITMCGLLFGIK